MAKFLVETIFVKEHGQQVFEEHPAGYPLIVYADSAKEAAARAMELRDDRPTTYFYDVTSVETEPVRFAADVQPVKVSRN